MIEYFEYIQIGDFIYAGAVKSKFAIDIKIAYLLLEELKKLGFLTSIYEVYCSKCGKSLGLFINSIRKFPKDLVCSFCDEALNPIDDLIMLYKVVKI